ncbi:peptide ABC transporter substrate-binding protein [Nicoliella spurrieriana]|uniref:Peptide ABC transporter substrate-binding protein n=1 Tax=Nicoliella spurrieriana TaxID=2925830 RepID=A0A976X4Z7_9LACO|nr:peptide ABC transporter substrate-binding protein [Nicoliella spurrieriana]UQS86310.1 peptide ABC transporter substrate-binding protein [Nicoliella spurrieriana]
MKLKTLAKVGSVTLVTALGLAACGSSNSSSESGSTKTLTWQESANLPTLDPSKATDNVSMRTLNNSNEGLLMVGNDNKVQPGVAKSYSVSKDGKTYTFNLRKSKWSDGSELTAKDFVYGIQRTANPKTASQYSYLLDHVKNYEAVSKKQMPVSSLGVKAEGNYKLVITLSKPQSYFKYIVAMSPLYPQSEKAVKKYGSAYGTKSADQVYNGPYKVTGWTGTNDSWTLTRNKDYYNNSKTKLDKVKFTVSKDAGTTLNQYQAGKFDVATLSGKQQVNNFKNSPQLHDLKQSSMWYLEMNQKSNPVLKNENIRKAISLAIDRKALTKDVLGDGSTPAKGLVPTGLASHDGKDFADAAEDSNETTNDVSYNLAEAKKYWAKGLKEVGKKSVSLGLLADDTPTATKNTEAIQSDLTKLPGLKITNQNLPFKTRLTNSQNGKFDLVLSGWNGDYPDPITFLDLFTSDNAYNNGHWKNAEYDKYVSDAEGKDANNAGKRWDDLVNAEKVLMDNAGIVPLYQPVLSQVRKDNVKGLEYSTTGPGFNFRDTYIK